MTAVEFLRDYLSKWGPEMDLDEYEGMAACIKAMDASDAAVAAEREACAKIAEQRFPDPLNSAILSDLQYDRYWAAGQIAAAIRARGSQ